jgi:Rps23 Pro-64 3,4-dihydroxylase Tpa1-like proline 4-hydroxylase
MNLVYNLEDKLFWIHNFLPIDEYKKIHNEVFKQRKLLPYKKVNDSWDKGLINNQRNIPKTVFIEHDYFNLYKTLLLQQSFIKLDNKNFNFTLTSMENGSGVNWHSDGFYKYGITFYINKRWNHQWGGEFMFSHNNTNSFLPIVGNSVIIIKTPIFHKVNTVISTIIPRMSIQSFIR